LDGFIRDGLAHYVSVSNGKSVFNYYMFRRWFLRKIAYLHKRLTGFFSRVPRAKIRLCDKCKVPIESDISVEIEEIKEEEEEAGSTPVVSQMEVYPGQVPELVSEPSPSASPLARRPSFVSTIDAAPSTPRSTQEKI
jgi:hypothetical protein